MRKWFGFLITLFKLQFHNSFSKKWLVFHKNDLNSVLKGIKSFQFFFKIVQNTKFHNSTTDSSWSSFTKTTIVVLCQNDCLYVGMMTNSLTTWLAEDHLFPETSFIVRAEEMTFLKKLLELKIHFHWKMLNILENILLNPKML